MSELDAARGEAENGAMRRAPKIVLVIAALLGLLGQTVAVAAAPTGTAIEATAPATMPMDCVGMMQSSGGNSIPCNRMTLACIAGMGGAILFTVGIWQPIVAEAMPGAAFLAWPVIAALEGRSAQPEQHPPNILA